ncbi:signal recognition particle protein [candidate division WOR-3 bacterium]|uniref:signal-recognition-particle GTPase n=1 Tax=candidate division WOR-3 bacterium TaxID=2052148 RepID=A0A660SIV1_UNCW3|nr:MAG: signal recognition particle protein [candidate division WOR-3 bacterium]
MFETLIDQFQILKRKVLGYGRVTKKEIDEFLKDLRITLLSADVNYKVVKRFINDLRGKLEGLPIDRSIRPGEMILAAVYRELVEILGKEPAKLTPKRSPSIINLIGLQGTGKTTSAGKLAHQFRSLQPILVALDNKRPAAKEQLRRIAQRANAHFYTSDSDPVMIASEAVKEAERIGSKLIILDTAGRLHIDDELVIELVEIKEKLKPEYNIIVVDGMTGQDAVIQAKTFHERVGLDGAIITKLDGDARGGAAISLRSVARIPIYYIGVGERLDDLEAFYPDRIAQRILGLGDVRTLIEKTEPLRAEAEVVRKKVAKGEFDLEDLLSQLKAIKRLGPIRNLVAMIPGMAKMDVDEKELVRIEAIINSMTPKERRHPEIIDGSRKRRIAKGSGTRVEDINQLLKQYFQLKKFMKRHGRDLMRRGIVIR